MYDDHRRSISNFAEGVERSRRPAHGKSSPPKPAGLAVNHFQIAAQEMLNHPALAAFAPEVVGRSTYLFPVSTSQKRYGILSMPQLQGQQFAPEDVNSSVLWRPTSRSHSSARWPSMTQRFTNGKW
jgi:hypothetical protein